LKINENEEQVSLSSKVHMVEEGSSSKKPFQKKRQKKRTNFQNQNQNQNRDKKAKFACYHCGKPGHFKKDCRFLKKKKQASDSKEFVAMISEIFMLEEDGSWWIDSCASRHVCKEMSLFKTFETVENGCILFMGNSTTAAVKGKGTVNLEFTSGNVLTLTDVYYVLEIRKNLVSGGLLNKFGFKCVFESDQFVLTKGGTFVGKGYLSEDVFKLNLVNKLNVSAYMIDSISLWHNRLGHVNTRKLHDMSVLNLIPHSVNDMVNKCRICLKMKIFRKSFPKIDRSSTLLQLVHSDVCDMHSNPTRGGKKYFVTFIDDFSKLCYVYLLFSKDEVLENFKIYKTEVENQCDARIKCLRSDRGGEFHFPSYCESVGIIHETSIAYTPQQNGVAERKNRTLVEMVNTLLCNSGLNKSF
jgi:hypothetical protein